MYTDWQLPILGKNVTQLNWQHCANYSNNVTLRLWKVVPNIAHKGGLHTES